MVWIQYQNQDHLLNMIYSQRDIMVGKMKKNRIKINQDHHMGTSKIMSAQKEWILDHQKEWIIMSKKEGIAVLSLNKH